MFCSSCGQQMSDEAYYCYTCGNMLKHPANQPQQSFACQPEQVPPYKAYAILSVLLCGPLAVVPVIYFWKKVSRKLKIGDIKGAKETAYYIKVCFIASALAFALGITLGIILIAMSTG